MTQLQQKLATQRKLDWLFVSLTKLFAFLVLASLVGIMITLIVGAIPSMQHFGWGFFTSKNWDPVAGEYGALAPVFGTIVTSVIALIVAVPVSFGIAIFLTELSPAWLKRPLGIAVELLAGVPSIIYGM